MRGDVGIELAVLVIDASGKVVAANTTARTLWQDKAKPLVNAALPELVAYAADPASTPPPAGRWEQFRLAALDQALPVELRPVDGSSSRPMTIRLERSYGGGGTYIAALVPR